MGNEPVSVSDAERGTTLIELLMGIVVTGIILGALTGGIMTYLQSANGVRYLLSETPELQLAATRFASDIQSSVTVSTPSAGSTPACGSLPSGASSTTLVDLSWVDPEALPDTSDDQTVVVSYTYAPTTHELQRAACRNGGLVEQATLVSHIQPSQTPQVQCDLSASCSGTPKRLDLAMQVCTANSAGVCLDSTIPATLTGIRRLS